MLCRILSKNNFKKKILFLEKREFFKKPPINVRNHVSLHSQNTEISITFERKHKSKFHPGRSLELSPRVVLTFSKKNLTVRYHGVRSKIFLENA